MEKYTRKVLQLPTENVYPRSPNHDHRGKFIKGHTKFGGAPPKTPRPIAKVLINSLMAACSLVGYDADVRTKDKDGNEVIDESKRILGFIPYLRRTAELHRPETLAIIGKILAPMMNNLQINLDNNNNKDSKPQTREEIENQLKQWGISINIFHGDEGQKPIRLVEYDND